MMIDSDFEKLLKVFPDYIKEVFRKNTQKSYLIEIIMDLGRRPEARFLKSSEYLSDRIVSWQDLDYTEKRLGKFSDDNRAGIERTLHRISCIRNRQNIIIGLTCRIGRCILGKIGMIRDLLASNHSLLILGKPGIGKTTLIREISRVLSDEMGKRVIIVDTANEIAGDSDIPHPGIGRARRMQVAQSEEQHKIMIEAVENHMPEVILIDEIGTELEALAARTIAERGVQLIGTAHGNALDNLIKNPILCDLIGGIQYVTLSDEEAKRRGRQKTILERKALATFQIAIELNNKNTWTIHQDVETSVDFILQGHQSNFETRSLNRYGVIKIKYTYPILDLKFFFQESYSSKPRIEKIKSRIYSAFSNNNKTLKKRKTLLIYSYYVSTHKIEKICIRLGIFFLMTKKIEVANILFISKVYFQENILLLEQFKKNKIPSFILTNKDLIQLNKMKKLIVERYMLKGQCNSTLI
jgi:stage III sporulation protein SpoIIIAA